MLTTHLIILFLAAFLPPIIYAVWIRNTEKYNREKWRGVFLSFLWGATIAIIAAVILEVILNYSIAPSINPESSHLIAIVVIAPFAEELAKPLALRIKTIKRELDEPEDGLIYGAIAGLGFSATENLFYGYDFLSKGIMFFLVLIFIRSVGGCLLHASATALTGYGYGKKIIKNTGIIRVIPYFIVAIIVHAIYNSVLVFDIFGAVIGLFSALLFSVITISLVRKKILVLDSKNK